MTTPHYLHLDEHELSLIRLVTGLQGQMILEELSLGTSHSIRLSPDAQERLYSALGSALHRPLLPDQAPAPLSTPMPLDEMQAILEAAGYCIAAPVPAWQQDSTMRTATGGGWAPAPETVLDHCLAVDIMRQGVAVEVEVRQRLQDVQVPPEALYADWGQELARTYPHRWPWEG